MAAMNEVTNSKQKTPGKLWLALLLGTVAAGFAIGHLTRPAPLPAVASQPPPVPGKKGPAPWAPARFARAPAPLPSLDVTAADYDPVRLIEEQRQTSKAIFLAEPRDPVWADAMEKGLRDPLTNDLAATVPGITDLTIECRTTACRIAWDAHGGEDPRARAVIRMLYGGAAMGHDGSHAMVVIYEGGTAYKGFQGHAPELLARLSNDRAMRLPKLRAGEFSRHAYTQIPAGEWPQP
jgi:hypothetical protein